MVATSALDRRRGRAAEATFPVIEVFGPTVQGEGPDAGRPAYFVRFGGCDYRCS
jgi:7-carboxy-7-deazaguanine synthase